MKKKNNMPAFADVKGGDILSRISYLTIQGAPSEGRVVVKNEEGHIWEVDYPILQKECIHATYFESTEQCSRTAAIEVLMQTNGQVFTVSYDKQPTQKDYIDLAYNEQGKSRSKAEITQLWKSIGVERIMTCYIIGLEKYLGRAYVMDMELPKKIVSGKHDSRWKQIDFRTLNWVIYNGVKYIIKK
jgi:hypothetical protein